MGSGLILLVIVGAWLAVLVPMGLRSSDSSATARPAAPLGDAVRVLSRRRPLAGSTRIAPGPPAATTTGTGQGEGETRPPAAPVVRRRVPLAVRRRRVLAVLVGLAAVLLVAGLASGLLPLLLAGGVALVLAAAFVVHCRQQAVLAARRRRRDRAKRDARAERPRRSAERVRHSSPLQHPLEEGLLERGPLEVPPHRVEDEPAAVPVAAGASWQPVPVPLPTYVAKNRAVAPRPRTSEPVEPGAWAAALQQDDAVLVEDGEEIDAILDRRRAVGGW